MTVVVVYPDGHRQTIAVRSASDADGIIRRCKRLGYDAYMVIG